MPLVLPAGSSQRPDVTLDRPGVVPLDPPRAHGSGPAPYRVLAVGGRLLAGHGVLTHDLAVTGALARALARLLGHGADVEAVIAERSATAVSRALRRHDLSRVDALIVILDPSDGVPNPAATVKRTKRLVSDLWQRLTPAASVTLVVPPPALARRSDADTASFAAAVREGAAGFARVILLTDQPDHRGPAARYGAWGDAIATSVAETLIDPLVWCDPEDELDEPQRSAAVRRLGPIDAAWETEFRRIVTFAARAYGARSASITVIDGDHARYLARQGFDVESVPRGETICDLALRTYGGVIVGDALADPRFREYPLVASGDVRFYAGYRVESPDGQPIGALCVFDDEPRPVLTQDLGLLRDFAHAAERRVWELTRRNPAV